MNPNNKIGIATEELYRIFDILNATYFSNQLEPPIITIQKAKRSGNLGWFTHGKVWTTRDEQDKKHEINISAEHLGDNVNNVVDTLLHEMVHYKNKLSDIRDVNGQIHNKKFKVLAESVGLIVTQSKKYGWGHTNPSDQLLEFIEESIKPNVEAFAYFRKDIVTQTKTPTERKKTQFKYKCPSCGEIIKAKKDKRIICGDCEREFEIEDDE